MSIVRELSSLILWVFLYIFLCFESKRNIREHENYPRVGVRKWLESTVSFLNSFFSFILNFIKLTSNSLETTSSIFTNH